jgi:hypothetical protein
MLIEDKALKHWIDNFYGYGSWDSRLWFIANEEGGGDLPEDVADKLDYFKKVHPPTSKEHGTLCDVRDLYKHVSIRWEGPKAGLYRNLYEYRFGLNAVQHGVWKNLIAFAHGYRNQDLPDLLEFQKMSFVLPSSPHEALIRLYPLPSPHNHGWYYSWLDMPQFGFLKSRALYQEHVYSKRIHTIVHKIHEHKPDVVLMYGMNNINALKKSVQEFFDDVQFMMVKAVKHDTHGTGTPQHHRANLDGTTLLITTQLPALRHGRVETGFDWYTFGEMVR